MQSSLDQLENFNDSTPDASAPPPWRISSKIQPFSPHSSKSNMWFSVATKNSFAVALMEQEQYIDATKLLREVLVEIRDHCDEANTDSPASSEKGSGSEHQVTPFLLEQSAHSDETVHRCAFELPPAAPQRVESAAVVVLYNIALAIHCDALQKGSSTGLRKALGVYERCHQICGNVGDDHEIALILPVVASVVHNIGSIYNTFYQRDQARAYRYQLMQLLDGFAPCSIGMESYAFYQRSVFFDSASSTQGAAAA